MEKRPVTQTKGRNRTSTQTSAFGTRGRIAHDSSPYYARRLYEGLPREEQVEYGENAVPPRLVNKVILGSSESMAGLPDCCIHLMVTSPPYNVGKDYDEDLDLEEYRTFLRRVMAEVYRVLVPGGRACINVANLGRRPYLPLHAFITQDMLSLNFLMRGEIIWEKGSSSSPSTAWGSWKSPANPTLRDTHEYVLIFCKQTFTRANPNKRESTIDRDAFLQTTKSVWQFPAEPARKIGHPAPFPVELPARLIQLYTFAGEIVLDPFMGSGSTAIAALKSGRQFVGYEADADYVALAEKRIAQVMPPKAD